jgi:RimJ/RimL family protein N-acetyltransferase
MIASERLILRDWRESDWEPFFDGTNTPEVMRWLGGVMGAAKMAEARTRLETYASEHGHTFWVVERRADNAVLGFCGLKRSNQLGGPQGDFEVGWRLRRDAWGQGYAREAAVVTLDHAFTVCAAPHVLALTVADNQASWGLMERLGMMRRPDLDFDSPDFDPATGRVIAYAIDRAAWAARA